MKASITNLIKSCRWPYFSQIVYSLLYSRSYKSYLRRNNITLKKFSTHDVKKKWNQLAHIWETTTFEYYANYLNSVDDIVPESIGRTCIEQILNPYKFRWYYSDKNMFPVICGENNVVKTILCRINGGQLLDGKFQSVTLPLQEILKNYDKVLLKPSIESKGGLG